MKTYKHYSDGGHGWLAVKRVELEELEIAKKISGYSYQRGKTVYLEEDCDMTTFIKAYQEKHNHEPKIEGVWDKGRIRSYNQY